MVGQLSLSDSLKVLTDAAGANNFAAEHCLGKELWAPLKI
jgi:hypothetical protein